MKFMNGDMYTNAIVSGITEVISYVLVGVLYDHFGFKKACSIFYNLSIIGMMCMAIF